MSAHCSLKDGLCYSQYYVLCTGAQRSADNPSRGEATSFGVNDKGSPGVDTLSVNRWFPEGCRCLAAQRSARGVGRELDDDAAFGGQFADPQSLDLRFPGAYRRTNEAWQASFGEPLFQPLHEDDRHVLC